MTQSHPHLLSGSSRPVAGSAIALIQATALRDPHAIVATQGEVELRFGDLIDRSRRMAAVLKARGIGPGDRVAVNLPRDIDLLPALLGVLWTGAAFSPIPIDHPALFRDAQIDDLQPAAVISAAGAVPSSADNVVQSDSWRRSEPLAGPPPSDGESPAYVMYTSGTTGRPKGVVITQGGLANYLQFAAATYFKEAGGAPVATSIGFDLSLTSLLVPLVAGQAAHFLREGAGFLGLFEPGRKFSVIKATPSHLLLAERGGVLDRLCAATHTFVLGGEPLSGALASMILAMQPDIKIFNEYGPTETVVGSTVHEISAADLRSASAPIGLPIWNTDCLVVDDDGKPVPLGGIGQLLIGGAGVSPGYWRRPELTRERFGDEAGGWRARHYKTGDLVRRLPDGALEFIGRRDNQVKINGARVEVEGVRAAILEHPDVLEAIIATVDGSQPQLAAYVVAKAKAPLKVSELSAWLRGRLPAWMIPQELAILDEISLTAGGKVDFEAMRATVASPPMAGRTVQEIVRAVWLQTLKLDEIDDDRNFLDAGGTSFEAIVAIQDINARLSLSLLPTVLFEHPTVAALSRFIDQGGHGDAKITNAVEQRTRIRTELGARLAQRLKDRR